MAQNASLVFDRRAEVGDGPAVHALIAGVNRYPHLPGGDGTLARQTFGLRALSAAAPTAHRMRSWLEQNASRLPVPLATIRLLVSESDAAQESLPCTLDNFLTAAVEWHEDALRHRDGVTWLYLVGHALTLRNVDHVFLLEDFGNGVGPLLRNAVNVNNILNGMSPSLGNDGIARTQWYFLDLGRQHASSIDERQWANSTAIFDTDLPTIDDREAAVYYASESGAASFAVPGKVTLFNDALLECLDGKEASVAVTADDGRWCITSTSLIAGFERALTRRAETHGVRQRIVAGGSIRNGVLCYLDGPPLVDLHIDLDAGEGRGAHSVEIYDSSNQPVHIFGVEALRHELRTRVPAGLYRVMVVEDSPMKRSINKLANVSGPKTTLNIKLSDVL